MRRRDFIKAIAGLAAARPISARAQQPERIKRVGVLIPLAADDPQAKLRADAVLQALQQLGWIEGRNVHIDIRLGTGGNADMRRYAEEMIALSPDVILASGSAVLAPVLQLTNKIPVVFVVVPDPVGGGFVNSLAQPGGNATGFMMFEYGLAAKWLELLKEVAPGVTRVGVLRDATIVAGVGQFAIIQSVAPSVGVDVSAINLRNDAEIARDVAAFARSGNAGLILTASAFSAAHRDLIIDLAARYKLPAVYVERVFVAAGGLISYGPNFIDQHRQAAGYIDRILKGAKPADLPVQAPTKYELVVNLKTAKALGLSVPHSILSRADAVIE